MPTGRQAPDDGAILDDHRLDKRRRGIDQQMTTTDHGEN
jgi:hypothetical protein